MQADSLMGPARITVPVIVMWLVAWTLVSLVFVRIELADAARVGFSGAGWEPWVWAFSAGYAYALLGLAVVAVCWKWVFGSPGIPAVFLKLLLLYVPTAVLFTTLMLALRHLAYFVVLGEAYPIDDLLARYAFEFPRSFVLYLMVVFVAYTWFYQVRANEQRLRAIRLESELRRARLQALQDQLQPHFLFNTLNLISNRMYDDPNSADKIMTSLANLLRYSLSTTDRPMVTLQEELNAMKDFMEIVQQRFGERFSYSVDVASDCGLVEVPAMLLQPLLENAVKHGIEPLGNGGVVSINADMQEGALRVRISNPVNPSAPPADTFGVGLDNVRMRLHHFYGDSGSASINQDRADVVVFTLTLPIAADG